MKLNAIIATIIITSASQILANETNSPKQSNDPIANYTIERLNQIGTKVRSVEHKTSLNPFVHLSHFMPPGLISGGLESDGIVKRFYLVEISFDDGSSTQCYAVIGTPALTGETALPEKNVAVSIENCGENNEQMAPMGFIPEQ